MKKRTMAAAVAIGAGLLLAVAAPLAASAHVALVSNTAEAGSYTLLTFKVPNESETAHTASVEFHLPPATPFASVSYVPTPGWTTKLTTTTLPTAIKVGESSITEAVTSVTFTADAGTVLGDGQLQLFTVSLGPVPDVDSVKITATQTYSDASVVQWDGSGDEPAPVLYVNATPPADHEDGVEVSTVTPAAHEAAAATSTEGSDTLARILGIGGLVVGAVGIVIAVVSRRARA